MPASEPSSIPILSSRSMPYQLFRSFVTASCSSSDPTHSILLGETIGLFFVVSQERDLVNYSIHKGARRLRLGHQFAHARSFLQRNHCIVTSAFSAALNSTHCQPFPCTPQQSAVRTTPCSMCGARYSYGRATRAPQFLATAVRAFVWTGRGPSFPIEEFCAYRTSRRCRG